MLMSSFPWYHQSNRELEILISENISAEIFDKWSVINWSEVMYHSKTKKPHIIHIYIRAVRSSSSSSSSNSSSSSSTTTTSCSNSISSCSSSSSSSVD